MHGLSTRFVCTLWLCIPMQSTNLLPAVTALNAIFHRASTTKHTHLRGDQPTVHFTSNLPHHHHLQLVVRVACGTQAALSSGARAALGRLEPLPQHVRKYASVQVYTLRLCEDGGGCGGDTSSIGWGTVQSSLVKRLESSRGEASCTCSFIVQCANCNAVGPGHMRQPKSSMLAPRKSM
jgi:hypothetical protein